MTMAPITEPIDFSLVQGGPLFQLMMRAHLVEPSMKMLPRRMVAMIVVAWVPLLILTAMAGTAVGGEGVPFLYDLGAHARLLLCVPVLIAAEVIVHKRMRDTVRQFIDRRIVAVDDQPKFNELVQSAMRLRNSALAEILLLACVVVGIGPLGHRYVSFDVQSWFSQPVGDQTRLSPAGYWYLFVSLTIFRFLVFRWYFRILVWYRFLWQVSRKIPLCLNALHPDRAGGLGFLANSVFAFQPLLLAHMIALSGILGGRILNEHAKLPQFQLEIVFWIIALIILVLGPLLFFAGKLAETKRAGLREYGVVASRYVADFHRKWVEGRFTNTEPILGTADIQSLADLSNSFETVSDMRILPFGKTAVVQLAITSALPLAPLLLTVMPLEQLIARALGIFL